MILSTILSFFGGSAFRMLWGEISAWVNKKQDHAHELQMLEAQGRLAAEQHTRNLEAIRVQAELGVQTIRTQAEADVSRIAADAWSKAVEGTTRPTGVWLVDLWNGLIRPALATMCAAMVALHFHRGGWVLDEQGWALVGAVLGIYVADRALFKRGK